MSESADRTATLPVDDVARHDRYRTYDDAIVRAFLVITLVWGVVGLLVGVIAAIELALPQFNLGIPFITFGRLRPLHTNAASSRLPATRSSRRSTTRPNGSARRACSATF
jgi:hypothetical protein